MLNHHTCTNNVIPKKISQFPRYNGLRTIEYIPVVLSVLAICPFVFLPEVPFGANPTVRQRTAKPRKDIAIQKSA